MQFKSDYKYKIRVEELSSKYNKFTPVFDCNSVMEVGFELGNKEILIQPNTSFGSDRYIYRFRQIKKIVSFTDGLMVFFKDKKFIFLPVTDSEVADEDLIFIAHTLYEQLRGKFHINSRLYVINYNSDNQKRKRINLSFTESPIVITIMAVIVILLGALFTTTPDSYIPVSRDKCIVYTGEYESFDKDEDDSIYIYFENGDEQWVDYSCYSSQLFSKMAALKKGDKLEILLHPENEFVVEIVCGGEELLNLDFAQKAMYEDVQGMDIMGYVVAAIGVIVLIFAIFRFVAERPKKEFEGQE